MGNDSKRPGGWSMVFEDPTQAAPSEGAENTAPSLMPERTVAQPAPTFDELQAADSLEKTDAHLMPDLRHFDDDDGDPPTIIDPSLAAELQLALEPLLNRDTDPVLDERLANMAVELEEAADSAPPERTTRSASPFEVRVTPVIDEFSDTLLDPAEKTQRSRIPYDLRAEQTLPPPARERVRRAPVDPRVIPVSQVASPPAGPAPATSRSSESSERTSLDLAAALGMPPERPAAKKPSPTPPTGVPQPELLRVPEAGAGPALNFQRATPSNGSIRSPAAPRAGLRSDQLAGLASATDRISRLIPVVLVILVVLATIAVSLRLFKPEVRQEHVELRFLALGGTATVTRRSETGTQLIIETDPPGLLVLFDRQVLGKTPFTGSIPLELGPTVAVELSSPYFERWLGEVQRGPAGDYTINVELARRARR